MNGEAVIFTKFSEYLFFALRTDYFDFYILMIKKITIYTKIITSSLPTFKVSNKF